MSSAAAFIRDRIGEFGILGTNNRIPDFPDLVPYPAPTYPFTKNNHYRFGYNDGEFNRRPSPSALYWVEYGRPSRKHDSLKAELRRAITEMHEAHGKLSITNSHNATSRAIVVEARALGIPVEQITVEIEGHKIPPIDAQGPHGRHTVSWDAFAEFALSFAKTASCWDPWFALEAIHGHVSDRAHVYSNIRFNFNHHNWEAKENAVAGPPTWGVGDWETGTSINRWLLQTGKVGVPQVLYWSPELIAAQLDHIVWRERFRQASQVPPELNPLDIVLGTFATLKSEYPDTRMFWGMNFARNDPAFDEKMKNLGGQLWRSIPRQNSCHYSPLRRFLRHFGVEYAFPFDKSEELYGQVRE
jgi:hypothetical protein